jgi:predicted nucleotidyltransferase
MGNRQRKRAFLRIDKNDGLGQVIFEERQMIKSTVARQDYYEREARRRAQREAERQQWIQRVREVVVSCASRYPDIRRVYLFGSLLQPGRFRPDSDIDVAVECDTLTTESIFWRSLECE